MGAAVVPPLGEGPEHTGAVALCRPVVPQAWQTPRAGGLAASSAVHGHQGSVLPWKQASHVSNQLVN